MTTALATNLGTLLSILIAAAAIYRDFGDRVVAERTLWARPGTLSVLALALTGLSLHLAPQRVSLLGVYLLAGIVAGLVAGALLARATKIRGDGNSETIVVRGTAMSLAIWIVFIVARIAVRIVYQPALPIVGLDLSVGFIAVVATAVTVLAFVFRVAIRAQRATGGRALAA